MDSTPTAEQKAIAKANRQAERRPGREYVVVKRTAHPAVEGGLAFIPAPADELHTLAADASIIHRVTFNGVTDDGLASCSITPRVDR